jgi:hypothetical protein
VKNILRLKWALVVFVFLLQGCVYLSHSSELLFLKSFADNEKEKENYIRSQETGFVQLKQDISDGRLNPGILKKEVIARYFEPINCLPIEVPPDTSACLYRNPTKYFFSDKIYLYFDEHDTLTRWELIPKDKEN